MPQAAHTNNWVAPAPGPGPLPAGAQFVIRTGPRRLVWPGVVDYFQKHNYRYRCRVVSVTQEDYRRPSRYNERARRCVATVEVVQLA